MTDPTTPGSTGAKLHPGKDVTLRVMVCSPGKRPIANATVKLTELKKEALTGKNGIALIALREDELESLTERTGSDGVAIKDVTFEASRRHHGPMVKDPAVFQNGPVTVKTVLAKVTNGYAPNAPGVEVPEYPVDPKKPKGPKKKGPPRLVMVLVEGGTLGVKHDDIAVRRLTDDEVHEELLYYRARGLITLVDNTEPTFEHSFGETDDTSQNDSTQSCDDQCKLKPHKSGQKKPRDTWITIDPTICEVKVVQLSGWDPDLDAHFLWSNRNRLRNLNPRHAVGLIRLCKLLKGRKYTILYTGGTEGGTKETAHGWGLAIDFHGAAKSMPEQGEYKKNYSGEGYDAEQRIENDFIVQLDWGDVFMWNPKKTLLPQADWERLSELDNGKNFKGLPENKGDRLRYRLKPVDPNRFILKHFKKVIQAPLTPAMKDHTKEASELFEAVYEFAVTQYSDKDTTLGRPDPNVKPDPATDPKEQPTPIDSHNPGFVLHPDFAYYNPDRLAAKKKKEDKKEEAEEEKKKRISNDRVAHYNHLHLQLGKTK